MWSWLSRTIHNLAPDNVAKVFQVVEDANRVVRCVPFVDVLLNALKHALGVLDMIHWIAIGTHGQKDLVLRTAQNRQMRVFESDRAKPVQLWNIVIKKCRVNL